MTCDQCGSDDAVVHLTQIVNNQMSTFHLCEKCAAAKGLDTAPEAVNFPLSDFLAQMGDGDAASPEPAKDLRCSFCGLTFQDFRDTGRLGCPHCYATFEGQLRGLLRRIHGGTQHVGKVYLTPDPSATDVHKRLETLRRKLQRAVDTEDFERAARLRDEIRTMEPAR
ncbi:MAG TPA: UvrB/UvrC motif-containing protein [Longimicrobiales bacterium]|nr:UvrB/UvrC motif-containing protein [Longimicrobiales bacterium]